MFSREKLTESTKLIVDRLGNEGYAFANVNPFPRSTVRRSRSLLPCTSDPGRRVYVRAHQHFGQHHHA